MLSVIITTFRLRAVPIEVALSTKNLSSRSWELTIHVQYKTKRCIHWEAEIAAISAEREKESFWQKKNGLLNILGGRNS